MFRFAKWLSCVGMLAAAVMLGIATPARADLVITISEDAGTPQTVVNVTGSPTSDLVGVSTTASTADYTVTVLSGQSFQTTSGLFSELLSSTTSITNTTGSSGHVLHITVEGNGYTSPTAPPPVGVLSHIGGAVPTTSSGNTLSFQSSVDSTILPVQTPSIGSVGSYQSDASTVLSSLTSPYAITETFDVTLNGLGDTINYSSATTLRQLPEPATMMTAFAAVPFLGLGAWLRRRKQVAIA